MALWANPLARNSQGLTPIQQSASCCVPIHSNNHVRVPKDIRHMLIGYVRMLERFDIGS
jgi:hypothetical protein